MHLISESWIAGHLGINSTLVCVAVIAVIALLLRLRPSKPTPQQLALSRFLELIRPLDDKVDIDDIEPCQHRPFNPPKKFALSMGLRKIHPQDWLMIDRNIREVLADKRHALKEFPKDLIVNTEEATAAVHETYDTVVAFLTQKYPKYYSIVGNHLMNNIMNTRIPANAESSKLSNEQLLKVMAQNFEEDFLLLKRDPDQDEYHLKAGCFVYPAGFNPQELLNKSLTEIHGPVPHYPERLQSPMNRFFDRLRVGEYVHRVNWACQEGTTLVIPNATAGTMMRRKEANDSEKSFDAVDVAKMHLRVERQTLSRLPQTGYLLFSIRTYLYPMSQIKEEGLGEAMAQAIENLDFHFGKYKGRDNWGETIVEYMRAT